MIKLRVKTGIEKYGKKLGWTHPCGGREMHAEAPKIRAARATGVHPLRPEATVFIILYTATPGSINPLPVTSATPRNKGVFLRNVIFHHLKTNLSFISRKSFPHLFCILCR